MAELLTNYGYISMFVTGFLAASVLPLGSEWLLVLLITRGFDPALAVLSATAGNYLGGLSTYAIGYFGGGWLTENILRLGESRKDRAESLYSRYGGFTLFFSWVPVVGDPLCFVSGIFRYDILRFTMFVFIGKCARYAFLAYVTVKSAEILTR